MTDTKLPNCGSDSIIEANIELHSVMAEQYNSCEPHFRPENKNKVESILERICKNTNAQRLLDLGCGTGFIIDLAKSYVGEIDGIDVTQAMLNRVDTSGPAAIRLFQGDITKFEVEKETYDVVTAYSVLHHLFEMKPAFETAYTALRSGGMFYADLEPNYYFWERICQLGRKDDYDPIISREIEAVAYKDEDIEKNFGVSADTFNLAEYGKNIVGGVKDDELSLLLHEVGFSQVETFYFWFVGQGTLIHDEQYGANERQKYAEVMSTMLNRVLPLSRSMFKYVGFIATK